QLPQLTPNRRGSRWPCHCAQHNNKTASQPPLSSPPPPPPPPSLKPPPPLSSPLHHLLHHHQHRQDELKHTQKQLQVGEGAQAKLDCIKELGKSLGLKSLVGSHRASTSWPGQNGQVQKVLRDLKAICETKYAQTNFSSLRQSTSKWRFCLTARKIRISTFAFLSTRDDLIGYPFSNDDMYRTIANISKQVYEMILQSVQKEKETHGGAPDKAPNHLITTRAC
ncbi:hypothetical protein TYRP_021124, partial [Tyrophagus putrescentiae]